MLNAILREYEPDRDAEALRECFIELQDHEADMVPGEPTGADIVNEYIPWMLERCEHFQGKLFVAEIGQQVVGFVTLLARVPRSEPDDSDPEYALISELVVKSGFRGHGIGKALMQTAEDYARSCGALALRIAVTAINTRAKNLYLAKGFQEAQIILTKRIG
ncbi:MAG: GNAT family N-acetyltransferase [Proteobacteria bacterium]|nr:GNAT family N-acetyltransferase [Pseudomonadota bacterium]